MIDLNQEGMGEEASTVRRGRRRGGRRSGGLELVVKKEKRRKAGEKGLARGEKERKNKNKKKGGRVWLWAGPVVEGNEKK